MYNDHESKLTLLKLSLFCFVLDIHPCESNPCVNGANCTNDVKSYTCSCIRGYIGVNCEIGIPLLTIPHISILLISINNDCVFLEHSSLWHDTIDEHVHCSMCRPSD